MLDAPRGVELFVGASSCPRTPVRSRYQATAATIMIPPSESNVDAASRNEQKEVLDGPRWVNLFVGA